MMVVSGYRISQTAPRPEGEKFRQNRQINQCCPVHKVHENFMTSICRSAEYHEFLFVESQSQGTLAYIGRNAIISSNKSTDRTLNGIKVDGV